MSGNLSVSSQPLVWSEKTVLENGIAFLNQKKEELNVYQNLWNASMGNKFYSPLDFSKVDYFYSPLSKTAAEKFKVTAEKAIKEIEVFDKAVIQLLDAELAKNHLSEQAKQLSKIALASRHGLKYFTSAVEDTHYPINLNWWLRKAAKTSNILVFPTATLTVAAGFVSDVTDYALPSYYSIPCKVSIAALMVFNTIYLLNLAYILTPSFEVNDLKNVFEKAIALAAIPAKNGSNDLKMNDIYKNSLRNDVVERSEPKNITSSVGIAVAPEKVAV